MKLRMLNEEKIPDKAVSDLIPTIFNLGECVESHIAYDLECQLQSTYVCMFRREN